MPDLRDILRHGVEEFLSQVLISPAEQAALDQLGKAQPPQQLEVMKLLGQIGGPNSLRALEELTHDNNLKVARAANETMRAIGLRLQAHDEKHFAPPPASAPVRPVAVAPKPPSPPPPPPPVQTPRPASSVAPLPGTTAPRVAMDLQAMQEIVASRQPVEHAHLMATPLALGVLTEGAAMPAAAASLPAQAEMAQTIPPIPTMAESAGP